MRLLRTRVTLANRLWLVVGIAILASVLLSTIALRVLEAHTMEERRAKIQAAVETVHGILQQHGRMAESG